MRIEEADMILRNGGFLRGMSSSPLREVMDRDGEKRGVIQTNTYRKLYQKYGMTHVSEKFAGEGRRGWYLNSHRVVKLQTEAIEKEREEKALREKEAAAAEQAALGKYEGSLALFLARKVSENSWKLFNDSPRPTMSEFAGMMEGWIEEFRARTSKKPKTKVKA